MTARAMHTFLIIRYGSILISGAVAISRLVAGITVTTRVRLGPVSTVAGKMMSISSNPG